MVCDNCGTHNIDTDTHCWSCGASLKQSALVRGILQLIAASAGKQGLPEITVFADSRVCTVCGETSPPGSDRCLNCGAIFSYEVEAEEDEEESYTCSACGADIEEDFRFCPWCGEKFDGS